MNYKREVEQKFKADPRLSYYAVVDALSGLLTGCSIKEDTALNIYWQQPGVDFVRLRENPLELTIKRTDKETIEDRIEENLAVDSFNDAERWATLSFGEPVGEFKNRYTIFTNEAANWTVSVYQVQGTPTVFIEVEAQEMMTVEEVSWAVGTVVEMEQEMRSLYQIMFGANGVSNG